MVLKCSGRMFGISLNNAIISIHFINACFFSIPRTTWYSFGDYGMSIGLTKSNIGILTCNIHCINPQIHWLACLRSRCIQSTSPGMTKDDKPFAQWCRKLVTWIGWSFPLRQFLIQRPMNVQCQAARQGKADNGGICASGSHLLPICVLWCSQCWSLQQEGPFRSVQDVERAPTRDTLQKRISAGGKPAGHVGL